MIIINISQAKAWVTLMKEADDGDGTLTYQVLFILFVLFMMLFKLFMMVILMFLLVFMLLMINTI